MSGPSDGGGYASPAKVHRVGSGFTLADLNRTPNGKSISKVNPSGLCIDCGNSADCANDRRYCLDCWRKKKFGGSYPAVFTPEF